MTSSPPQSMVWMFSAKFGHDAAADGQVAAGHDHGAKNPLANRDVAPALKAEAGLDRALDEQGGAAEGDVADGHVHIAPHHVLFEDRRLAVDHGEFAVGLGVDLQAVLGKVGAGPGFELHILAGLGRDIVAEHILARHAGGGGDLFQ